MEETNDGDTLRVSGGWRRKNVCKWRKGKGGIEKTKKGDWKRSADRSKDDRKKRGDYRRRGGLRNSEGAPRNNED